MVTQAFALNLSKPLYLWSALRLATSNRCEPGITAKNKKISHNCKTFDGNVFFSNTATKQSAIVAFIENSQGKFWVGKHARKDVFTRVKTGSISSGYEGALKQLQDINVTTLAEDKNKNVWIGLLTGCFYLKRKSNRYMLFL